MTTSKTLSLLAIWLLTISQVSAYLPYHLSATYQQSAATQDFSHTHADEMRLLCNTFRSAQYCKNTVEEEVFLFPNFVALLDTGSELEDMSTENKERIHVQSQLAVADLLPVIRYDIDYRFGGGVDAVYMGEWEYVILTGNGAVLTYSLQWNFFTYRKYAYGVEFVLPQDMQADTTDIDTSTAQQDMGIAISLDKLPSDISTDIATRMGRIVTQAYIDLNTYVVMLDTGETLRYWYDDGYYSK